MLAELIMYIALFATLFGGAFAATFQATDAVQILSSKKDVVDAQDFLMSRLDSLLQGSGDWALISGKLQFSKNNSTYSIFRNASSSVLMLQCQACVDPVTGGLGTTVQLTSPKLAIESFSPQIFSISSNVQSTLDVSLQSNHVFYNFSYLTDVTQK